MEGVVQSKYDLLKGELCELGSVAVAFSGGVDSTFLLAVAHEVLGPRAIALTASSVFFPLTEAVEAAVFCEQQDITQYVIDVDVLAVGDVAHNPKDRCYQCKRAIFIAMKAKAMELGVAHVIDGTNAEDATSDRPGLKALAELDILSPLSKAGLTKSEIRKLSQKLGLASASKPSMACLATRFPYGTTLEDAAFYNVARAEDYMRSLGFSQLRVRVDGEGFARIELPPEDFSKMMQEDIRKEIHAYLHSLGYKHVSLDLLGFRSGSMDE